MFFESTALIGLLWTLAILLIVLGVAGAVLPILPGVPLVLLGLILISWLDGFVRVGWGTLGLLTALTVLSILIDFFGHGRGRTADWCGSFGHSGCHLGAVVWFLLWAGGHFAGPVHWRHDRSSADPSWVRGVHAGWGRCHHRRFGGHRGQGADRRGDGALVCACVVVGRLARLVQRGQQLLNLEGLGGKRAHQPRHIGVPRPAIEGKALRA